MARESMMPLTTRPERVVASARLKTATLLKWSPISLTTWPHPGVAIVAVRFQQIEKLAI